MSSTKKQQPKRKKKEQTKAKTKSLKDSKDDQRHYPIYQLLKGYQLLNFKVGDKYQKGIT